MISSIAGIVSWVIGIIVLIKLFQKEGVMKGILGLICMLYTFYWGWKNANEQNITTMMWIWTGVIVLSVIVSVVFGSAGSVGGGGSDEGGAILRFFLM